MELLEQLLESDALHHIILRMALIVVVTLLLAWIVAKIGRKYWNEKLHHRLLLNIIKALLYITGAVFALDQIPNLNRAFSTLLAGSGIAALAISLAAQESLSNVINGLAISASKPFAVGDRVRLIGGNITGYIEDITMRHTIVRTFMNSRVIIPNSVINKDMIENSNFLEDRASGFIDVVITFDSDMERACAIMADVVEKHPDFVDTRGPGEMHLPKVPVYVRTLSVYGVELRASMWTANIGSNFSACSDVRRRLKNEFDASGIRFATGVPAAPYPG